MILHGMVDTAGQASYSVDGLKKNNIEAELVIWEKNKFDYPYDYYINENTKNRYIKILNEFVFGAMAFFKYDIFHFHNATSLFPRGFDLFLLSYFHKNFLMEFHGSELRWFGSNELPKDWPGEFKKITKKQKKILERIFRYTDTVILHDDELRKFLPPRVKRVYIVPLRIDVGALLPVYPDDNNLKPPVIVHAPSDNVTKGSKYVIEAIENLKQKYNFTFILVQNKSQKEAMEIYKQADIIIDQLFIGTYGVFAIEAMALGKPVLTYLSEDMLKTFPKELPIVNVNIQNLQERIERLIDDPKMRRQLGMKGRQFVECYHDSEVIARFQNQIYLQKVEPLPSRESFEYVEKLRSV